jgi:hypothetical protein
VFNSDTGQIRFNLGFDNAIFRKHPLIPANTVAFSQPCEATLPVGFGERIGIDPRMLIRDAAGAHWTLIPFKDALPDLYESTKFLTSLNLQDLVNHLREESNKEGEQVEMFGAKIPYDLVSILGSLMLAACQFYLWCHLLEVRQVFSARRSDQDLTSYIGFYYNQWPARVFTIVSVSVLPIAVQASVLWNTRDNNPRLVVLAIGMMSSVSLSGLLARCFVALWSVLSKLDKEQ